MSEIRVDSLTDGRLGEYTDVAEPELIRARGLFVAEGRRVVERLIEEKQYRIRSLLLSETAHAALGGAISGLEDRVPIYVCSTDQFLELTGYRVHRGCLALVERPGDRVVDEVIDDARLVIVLEEVGNADNVGGVFRNAAAFGAGAILLSPGCCDPLYRKAIRTSMAATLRVPYARFESWPDGLSALSRAGFTIVALTPRQPSEPLDRFTYDPVTMRTALLIGAEGAGLSEAVETIADRRVRIPIRAEVDSLNLAVAAGIALSRLTRGDDLE